jgi:amino acid transporter
MTPNIAIATSTGWSILTYATHIFGDFSPFFIFIIGIVLGFFILEFLIDLTADVIVSRREKKETPPQKIKK